MNRLNNVVFLLFLFLFMLPISNANSELDVDFHIVPDINKQTLYITITDLTGNKASLDINTVVNETDFPIQTIKTAQIYEKEPYAYYEPIYQAECSTAKVTNISGTFNVESCGTVYKGDRLIETIKYSPRQLEFAEKTASKSRNTWQSVTFDENHKVELKLEFNTSIVEYSNGWGSAGTVYLETEYGTFVDKTNSSWWNTNWTSRYEINLTNSDSKAAWNHTVNITINTAAAIAGGGMQQNCSDIRVLDDNNNSLPYWLENCNNASTVVWVLFNPLPTGTQRIWLYFNNSEAAPVATTDVWNPFYMRYAFNSSADSIALDSSANAWHGTCQGTQIQTVSGLFGNAYVFYEAASNAVNTTHQIPTLGSVYGMVDFYIKWSLAVPVTVFMYDTDAAADLNSNTESGKIRHRTDGATTTDALTAALGWSAETWYHIQNVWNGTHKNVYINGILNKSEAVSHGAATNNNGAKFYIGATNTISNEINATVDEFRVYKNTGWRENASHTLVIPDTAVSYVISSVQYSNGTGGTPANTINLNITVFDEYTPATQIETYNISMYKDGSKFYNATGTNATIINLNDTSIESGTITIVIDKEGYYQREQIIDNDKSTEYNLTFYLLETSKAVNVGYQVVDITARPLSAAGITIEKSISGSYEIISEYETDSSGFISVYLNSLTTYRITTTKSGYTTDVRSSRPVSGNSYLIVLNKTIDVGVESIGLYFRYWFYPQQPYLSTCDIEDFSFNVEDKRGNITYFGLRLVLNGSSDIAFYDNNTANLSAGALNRTLNLTGYTGNITLYGNVTISDFGTVTFTSFYKVENACNQGYSLDDLFRAFAAESTGISSDLAAIFLIFLTTFMASSVAGLIGGNGAGIIVYMFEIILPVYGFISWPLYILIGLGLFAVLYLRNRV